MSNEIVSKTQLRDQSLDILELQGKVLQEFECRHGANLHRQSIYDEYVRLKQCFEAYKDLVRQLL